MICEIRWKMQDGPTMDNGIHAATGSVNKATAVKDVLLTRCGGATAVAGLATIRPPVVHQPEEQAVDEVEVDRQPNQPRRQFD